MESPPTGAPDAGGVGRQFKFLISQGSAATCLRWCA